MQTRWRISIVARKPPPSPWSASLDLSCFWRRYIFGWDLLSVLLVATQPSPTPSFICSSPSDLALRMAE
ncbi:hypothetical protein DTO271G3_2067 [Paecilomyces variotii]|nr:hypothetical protein DTO271G3_2067 [Paecilomyces variotii]